MSARKKTQHEETVVSVFNDAEQRRDVERRFLEEVERQGYPEISKFPLRLALEEALVNAFKHGHRDLPDQPVRVAWRVERQKITLSIEDQGPGFRPDDVPDPTTPEALEKPSGRGLMLMRAYMTSVEYSKQGNRVTMVYERP
jgi:serine/threonine-protein kinase RsbW